MLIDRRDQTPRFRRAARRELDRIIDRQPHDSGPPVTDRLDDLLAAPPATGRPRTARDPLRHLDRLDRAPTRELPDHGMDLGL